MKKRSYIVRVAIDIPVSAPSPIDAAMDASDRRVDTLQDAVKYTVCRVVRGKTVIEGTFTNKDLEEHA